MYTFSTCNMRSNSSTDNFPMKIRAACIAVSEPVYGILNTRRGKTWRWNGDFRVAFFDLIFSKRITDHSADNSTFVLKLINQPQPTQYLNRVSCFAKTRSKGAWLSWFQIKLCAATITLSTGTTSRLHDKHRRTFSIKRTPTLRPHRPCKWELSAP